MKNVVNHALRSRGQIISSTHSFTHKKDQALMPGPFFIPPLLILNYHTLFLFPVLACIFFIHTLFLAPFTLFLFLVIACIFFLKNRAK